MSGAPEEIDAVTKEFYPDRSEEEQVEKPKSKSEIAQERPVPEPILIKPEEQSIPEPSATVTTEHQIPTSPIETIEEIQKEATPHSNVWDVKRICDVLIAAKTKTGLNEAWKTLSLHIAKLDKAGKVECQRFKNALTEVLGV